MTTTATGPPGRALGMRMTPTPPLLRRARPRLLAAASLAALVGGAAVALPLARTSAPLRTPSGAGGSTAARAQAVASAAAVYHAFPATPAPAPATPGTAAAASMAPLRDSGRHSKPAWRVGFDKEAVDPRPAEIASRQLHLGGYGLFPTRATEGPLVDGDGTTEHIYARAMAVSDATGHTVLLAALENQGTFAAYKQGPYGLYDVRQEVSRRTGVPVENIVINSDHSHAGPDLIGLWGGVPVSYLQYVHDQTVLALERAFSPRVPAQLLLGTDTPTMPTPALGGYISGTATPGEDLVHSQFGQDSMTQYPDQTVDTQLRVLQAVDSRGRPLGTLINYAAHATVMGGGNRRYSADWPGRAARATEQALGEGVALTMVADVGRSQPPRPHSNPSCGQPGQESCDLDQLDTYTRLITPWILEAVATAAPVSGSGVAGAQSMVRDAATNPALLGVSYTGEAPVRGYGAYRSATPPFATGTEIGSFTSALRIGNVLLTANPGEAYPDVRLGLDNELRGMQATFTFGLANDQLGYLIAPTSEYGWITASNPGNDNSFFNVAPQFGDHLMCTQLRLATGLGFTPTGNSQPYGPNAPGPNCAALTASDAAPMGPAPQQPWPFGDGVALPSPFPQ